jgi:hypothetical protein
MILVAPMPFTRQHEARLPLQVGEKQMGGSGRACCATQAPWDYHELSTVKRAWPLHCRCTMAHYEGYYEGYYEGSMRVL